MGGLVPLPTKQSFVKSLAKLNSKLNVTLTILGELEKKRRGEGVCGDEAKNVNG